MATVQAVPFTNPGPPDPSADCATELTPEQVTALAELTAAYPDLSEATIRMMLSLPPVSGN